MSAQPETQTRDQADEDDLQLEGISQTYCDDFVCTSSPQVTFYFAPQLFVTIFSRVSISSFKMSQLRSKV